MPLRTRLALAFAALAVLPLLVSAPFVARRLRATFDLELQQRADAAQALLGAELGRLRARVAESVAGAARDPAAEALARSLDGPGPLPAADATRALAEGRGLPIFGLVDRTARVLSSAHFPGRAGDVDEGLGVALAAPAGTVATALIQVRAPEGPQTWPALLAAAPVEDVPGTWVVGGVLLDTQLAGQLAALAGAQVEVRRGTELLALAGTAPGRPVARELALGAETSLRVSVGGAAYAEAEHALLAALGALVAAGLLLAVGLGILLARRITSPLEALTQGAQAVAAGQLDTRVQAPAGGEVGVLVEAFNRMTLELKKTTRKLLEAERIAAWEEVARGLAHELKNPLTPLQMSLETLVAAQSTGDPRFAELFSESAPAMREEVERLKRTVDAFARFARLPRPSTSTFDLGAWAEQALSLYGAPGGLRPEAALEPGLLVEADRDQLAQVLHNLLKNAEEAAGPGQAWVAVRARAEASWALLEVEDGGPGVPEEARERIFELSYSRKAGGSGLGLAIARRIATEHGGTLEVATGSRGGALFRLRLPRARS